MNKLDQLLDAYNLMRELESNGYRLLRSGSELILQDHDGVDVGINEKVQQNYDALLVVVAIQECFTEVGGILDNWYEQVLND